MRKGILINLVICLLLCACKKPDLGGISNLNDNQIQAIGHGGMGINSSYPINTYESLSQAISTGADGVEIDVQMTKDSVLVAFHNNELDNNTSCEGAINDMTIDELNDCEYVNEIFGLHRILPLSDLLDEWNSRAPVTIVFDCKLTATSNHNLYVQTFARQLIDLVESVSNRSEVLIESQDVSFLEMIKAEHPEYKLFIYPNSFEHGLQVALSSGFYGISLATSKSSKAQIEEAHANGVRVTLWSIDSRKDNVEAINKSPDYIQTDKLKSLINLLD